VVSAWFELLRLGGCGSGEVVLRDKFTLRGTIQIGHYVAFEYTSGDRWFLGRVEEIEEESPKGVTLSLFGMAAELTEVFPGGFDPNADGAPHRYARSDWFPNDPDWSWQTWDQVSQPNQIVDLLWAQ